MLISVMINFAATVQPLQQQQQVGQQLGAGAAACLGHDCSMLMRAEWGVGEVMWVRGRGRAV